VNQSVFIKVIQPRRVMGNETHIKSSQTQQLFIPVLIEQHISTWQPSSDRKRILANELSYKETEISASYSFYCYVEYM
jgi:hypothetical protein